MTNRGEPFRVTVSAGESGETRVAVQGELDSATAQELAAAYSEAVKRGELEPKRTGRERGSVRITLDLEGVDFIDSGGLRMLIAIQREAEEAAVQLTVLAPPNSVTQLLHLAGVVVTNGVVHSTGGLNVGLRLTTFPDAVRIEVDDPGIGFDPSDVPGEVPAPEAGGRGLFVVDRCSTRWGTRQADTDRGRRFSVWFELDTDAG